MTCPDTEHYKRNHAEFGPCWLGQVSATADGAWRAGKAHSTMA